MKVTVKRANQPTILLKEFESSKGLYMLLHLFTLLRTIHPPAPSNLPMARYIPRATLISITPIPIGNTTRPNLIFPPQTHRFDASKASLFFGRRFHALCGGEWRGSATPLLRGRICAWQRDYRKVRRRAPKSKDKELELNVSICLEEELPDDPEILVTLSICMQAQNDHHMFVEMPLIQ